MAPEQLLAAPPAGLAHRVTLLAQLAADTARAFDRAELVAMAGPLVLACCELDHLAIGLLADGGSALGSAMWAAVEAEELLLEPDIAGSSHPDLAELAEQGMTCALVVPLWSQGRPVGAIVAARRRSWFEPYDVTTLEQAAAVVAASVELQRTTELAQQAEVERHKAAMLADRRRHELLALDVMAAALDRFDLGHALAVMADELVGLRGIELSRIAIVGAEGVLVEVATGSCFGARMPEIGPGTPDHLSAVTGRPVLWRRPDEGDQATVDALNRLGVTSVFALPVHWESQLVATILAGSTGGHRLVTDEHLVVAGVAGQLLAHSLEHRHGIESLHRLAARAG